MQAVNQLRKNLDKQLAGGAEAIAAAEKSAGTPERIGTWYPRAKAFNEQINEPHQLDRWLEGVGSYSAGVSPESELAFNLKHWNSRALGDPQRAYRGEAMRTSMKRWRRTGPPNLVSRSVSTPRRTTRASLTTSPFGVNDFRMAQSFGYTTPEGVPWTAGVTDRMHPVMDAETALLVERANQRALGGRSDWTGETAQEIPWVAGKAQDLYERDKTARFAGGREGMIKALREANRTAATMRPSTSLVPRTRPHRAPAQGTALMCLGCHTKQRRAYGEEGSWIRPDDQKDVLYSALGLRQQPAVACRWRVPEHGGRAGAEPDEDVAPTGGLSDRGDDVPTGTIAPTTLRAVENTERMRALVDAQENRCARTCRSLAAGAQARHRGCSTRAGGSLRPMRWRAWWRYCAAQAATSMPTATPRGVQLLNFGDAKAAGKLPMDELRAAVPDAEVLPSAHEGAYVKGLGPVQGSGGYTARMLRHMTELPQHRGREPQRVALLCAAPSGQDAAGCAQRPHAR